MQRFRGGLVFKAHRLCVSLNSRLESNKEEVSQLKSWALGQAINALQSTAAGFDLVDQISVFKVPYATYMGYLARKKQHSP